MTSVAAKTSLFESSSNPSTYEQWKSTLQEIKLLYMQRQYKRCVARSSSILSVAREPIDPVYKTYLYFYSAISYEAMARHAHEYSRNKIPLLHSALDCFVTCLSVLPAAVSVDEGLVDGPGFTLESDSADDSYVDGFINISGSETDFIFEQVEFPVSETNSTSLSLSPSPSPSPSPAPSSRASRETSPAESIVSSITDIIDRTLDCPDEEDPFLSDCDDVVDILSINNQDNIAQTAATLDNENETEYRLMPPPLHVRKSSQPLPLILPSLELSGDTSASSKAQTQDTTEPAVEIRARPPRLPLPVKIKDLATNKKVKAVVQGNQKYTYSTSALQTSSRREILHAGINLPSTSSITAFNNSLAFLHNQVTSTITTLHTLIQEVTSIQHARILSRRSIQRSVSFWSFSPVKNGSGRSPKTKWQSFSSRGPSSPKSGLAAPSGRESLQERIIRLRSEGWETVGLKNRKRGWKGAEYYREFCGMVLDELYLG
ncbi:hypothetical protein ASPVEDRAFT_80405 [Aspergillus versicolor CBS 583.65]|uniref:Uncharacterized protein n=1 Tax=Aspergillus versicolor CBS 583.65 TaxID=1036611 RepID=A0A1L9PBD8_ASPVE|nr:uncharacterized protein ASPVEDRAFT_80405 [Aspergillus versicolor CBS 583.65]OJI98774.1 hypothetical protein ASPVEDRAFT_80405 [Aspergillus versicolor CBS 583.65]